MFFIRNQRRVKSIILCGISQISRSLEHIFYQHYDNSAAELSVILLVVKFYRSGSIIGICELNIFDGQYIEKYFYVKCNNYYV